MRKLNHDPEQITRAREAAKLTKTQLATALGCSLSLISEIESGTRNANMARLDCIARILGVPASELAARDEEGSAA